MAYQTNIKPVGLIKDLKIHIHGIPYIAMFTVMKNNVLNSNYSMLLGQPWLHNARVIHDWRNNIITIESNCRNLSLGLATKAKVCKGAGQE